MIPKVRSWKVTAKDTGKVIYVDTINRKFARWIANTERGMYGHDLTISVVKENVEAKALRGLFGDPGLRDC
jgi:hypothetical protein